MRISNLPALAACVSIGCLAVVAAYSGIYDTAAAAASTSQCEALPAPTPSATATATSTDTPTTAASTPAAADLCVSVQASQASIQQEKTAIWTVQVWAQNGPVDGVAVTLAATSVGQPVFTGGCPGGNGSASCAVGSLATDVTPASYELQAQLYIPSNATAGSAVTLTATADANPALSTQPAAAAAVSVTAAPASPGASHTPAPSRTPAASKTTAPGRPGQPTTAPPTTLPVVGSVPTVISPVIDPTGISGITSIVSPGSVGDLLPVITPAAGATPPTAGLVPSPAADIQTAAPAATTDPTSAGNFVLVMPAATAEILGIIILGIVITVATRFLATGRLVARTSPTRAPRSTSNAKSTSTAKSTSSAKSKPSVIRRLKIPAIPHPAIPRPRRRPSDSLTPDR